MLQQKPQKGMIAREALNPNSKGCLAGQAPAKAGRAAIKCDKLTSNLMAAYACSTDLSH